MPDLRGVQLGQPGFRIAPFLGTGQHQPAAGWAVHLDMETTGHEIVDVVPGAGATTPVGACLIEAVWALPLPTSFIAARAMHPLDFH